MALHVGRDSFRLLVRRLPNVVEGLPALVVPGGAVRLPVATLRATYGEKYPYAEPFPYERKKFNWWSAIVDPAIPRFNENTKVIVVEGNIGVGKTEFAQRLASEFDLRFFPPTPEKKCFTTEDYGFDVRRLDSVLPPTAQSYDLKKFYADEHPEKGTVGRLQLLLYEQKFYDYLRAFKHLVNTGQGIVLVRSVFSDLVFVEALRSMGWVSQSFVKYYNMIRDNSICDLYRPHLTIYLDAPLDMLRERIKKRNDPREVGSRNLTDQYLATIDRIYQQRFLPKMRECSEVVEVDWAEVASDADMDMIAEELQMIKLEGEDNEDPKFSDWARQDEDDWTKLRFYLEDTDSWGHQFVKPDPWDCPEVMVSPEDKIALSKLVRNHPVFKYAPGWAPEFGHKTLLKA